MPGAFGLLDSAILTEAKVSMSMAFSAALKAPYGLWYEQLTTVISSSGRSTKYPIMGGLTGMREWQGARHFEVFSRYAYEIVNRRFEKTVEIDVDDIADDQLDGYGMLAKEIGFQAAQWPQDLIAAAFLAGSTTTGFDGQNFFDPSHKVDLNDALQGTYANVFTVRALTADNLNQTMSDMMLIKARDGRPAGFGRSGKLLLIVPPQLAKTAKQIAYGDYLPVTVGANTTQATNVMKGMVEVLIIPELGFGGGANTTTWYLADVGHIIKPFIFQLRMAPQVTELTAATDENVFLRNAAQWGVKARGAAGFGMPWLMAKNTA